MTKSPKNLKFLQVNEETFRNGSSPKKHRKRKRVQEEESAVPDSNNNEQRKEDVLNNTNPYKDETKPAKKSKTASSSGLSKIKKIILENDKEITGEDMINCIMDLVDDSQKKELLDLKKKMLRLYQTQDKKREIMYKFDGCKSVASARKTILKLIKEVKEAHEFDAETMELEQVSADDVTGKMIGLNDAIGSGSGQASDQTNYTESIHFKSMKKSKRLDVDKYTFQIPENVKHFYDYFENQDGFIKERANQLSKSSSSSGSSSSKKKNEDPEDNINMTKLLCSSYTNYLVNYKQPFYENLGISDATGQTELNYRVEINSDYVSKMLVEAKYPFDQCTATSNCKGTGITGDCTFRLMSFVLPEEYNEIMATGKPSKNKTNPSGFCYLCLLDFITTEWCKNSANNHSNLMIDVPFRHSVNTIGGYNMSGIIIPVCGFTDGLSVPIRHFCYTDYVYEKEKEVDFPEINEEDGSVTGVKIIMRGLKEKPKFFFFAKNPKEWWECKSLLNPRIYPMADPNPYDPETYLYNFFSRESILSIINETMVGGLAFQKCSEAGCAIEDIVPFAFLSIEKLSKMIERRHNSVISYNPSFEDKKDLYENKDEQALFDLFMQVFEDFKQYLNLELDDGYVYDENFQEKSSAFIALHLRVNVASEILSKTKQCLVEKIEKSKGLTNRRKKEDAIKSFIEKSIGNMWNSIHEKLAKFVKAHRMMAQWYSITMSEKKDISNEALFSYKDWLYLIRPKPDAALFIRDLKKNVCVSTIKKSASPCELAFGYYTKRKLDEKDFIGQRLCPLNPIFWTDMNLFRGIVFDDFDNSLKKWRNLEMNKKISTVENLSENFRYWCPASVKKMVSNNKDFDIKKYNIVLLLLTRINELANILEIYMEELNNHKNFPSAHKLSEQQLNETSQFRMESSQRAQFHLNQNQADQITDELFYRMGGALASTLTKKRASSKNIHPHKNEKPYDEVAAEAYEFRMHCNTHLSMAKNVSDGRASTDYTFLYNLEEYQHLPVYLRTYPDLMRYTGEEDLPDMTHCVTKINFSINNQYDSAFYYVLRKFFNGVCFRRELIPKFIKMLKNYDSYMKWGLCCMRTSLMGSYKKCRRWPNFDGMLSLYTWTCEVFDKKSILKFIKRNVHVSINFMSEFIILMTEKNGSFDSHLNSRFDKWGEFKTKVRSIMDTVRLYQRITGHYDGINNLILKTFEASTQKPVFRSCSVDFKSYYIKRMKSLETYKKYIKESEKYKGVVPLEERKLYKLDDETRGKLDYYVSCMEPAGLIDIYCLIQVGLSPDGMRKMNNIMKMFINREPDIEIHKVVYTLSKRDYEIIYYFCYRVQIHFNITFITLPVDIAIKQDEATRRRYNVAKDKSILPSMTQIALVPDHGITVSHTADTGEDAMGNIRCAYDSEKKVYMFDKKETTNKSKKHKNEISMLSVKQAIASDIRLKGIKKSSGSGSSLKGSQGKSLIPTKGTRHKLVIKYQKSCRKTKVDFFNVRNRVLQFVKSNSTMTADSYITCPKCGQLMIFSIINYGTNGLSCQKCDYHENMNLTEEYCDSCEHKPKNIKEVKRWTCIDDVYGSFNIVNLMTCSNCSSQIDRMAEEYPIVMSSMVIKRNHDSNIQRILKTKAGKGTMFLKAKINHRSH